MTEVGRFFDAVLYGEADQAEVTSRIARDGVLLGYGNELAVISGGAGFASVNTGEAFLQGFHYKNDASKLLAITPNAGGVARVDLVVLRLDRVGNSLTVVIHDGVIGAGVPSPTQIVGGVWEMPIARISTTSSVSTYTDVRTWQPNMYNPMTTSQDIIIANAQGNPIRKAKGANGTYLGVDGSGNINWSVPIGFANPMTNVWDLIVGGASGAATRMAKGGNNTVFTTDGSGNLSFQQIITALISVGAVSQISYSSTFSQGTTGGPWTWISGAAQTPGITFSSGGFGVCIMWGYTNTNAGLGNVCYVGIGLDTNTSVSGQYQIAQGNPNCNIPFCVILPLIGISGVHVMYGVHGSSSGTVTTTGQMMVMELKR